MFHRHAFDERRAVAELPCVFHDAAIVGRRRRVEAHDGARGWSGRGVREQRRRRLRLGGAFRHVQRDHGLRRTLARIARVLVSDDADRNARHLALFDLEQQHQLLEQGERVFLRLADQVGYVDDLGFGVQRAFVERCAGEQQRRDGLRAELRRSQPGLAADLRRRQPLRPVEVRPGVRFRCLLHEGRPYLGRERATCHFAAVHVLHLELSLGIAHPDCCREVRRVADEPRVAILLRRTGLAGGGPPDPRCPSRASRDHALEQVGGEVRDGGGDGLLALVCGLVEHRPVRLGHPEYAVRGHVGARVRECAVR